MTVARSIAKCNLMVAHILSEIRAPTICGERSLTTPLKARLCHAARSALENAMRSATAARPINRIGAAIERTAKTYGLKIIENLGSHGVGRALHEEPANKHETNS